MAENPFVRMYRDLVRRINEMPQVRLSRVDPEAPAEPADGWALSVGRQRVALGAVPDPPTDTGWMSVPVVTGHTGIGADAPQCRVRDGIAYWRGRINRDAGALPAGYTHIANVPAAAQPAAQLFTSGVTRNTFPLSVAIDHRLQVAPGSSGSTAEIWLGSIPPYPVS